MFAAEVLQAHTPLVGFRVQVIVLVLTCDGAFFKAQTMVDAVVVITQFAVEAANPISPGPVTAVLLFLKVSNAVLAPEISARPAETFAVA